MMTGNMRLAQHALQGLHMPRSMKHIAVTKTLEAAEENTIWPGASVETQSKLTHLSASHTENISRQNQFLRSQVHAESISRELKLKNRKDRQEEERTTGRHSRWTISEIQLKSTSSRGTKELMTQSTTQSIQVRSISKSANAKQLIFPQWNKDLLLRLTSEWLRTQAQTGHQIAS